MQHDHPTHAAVSDASLTQQVAKNVLIVNLRNAHALEKQVLAVLQPQLGLLHDYPDLYAKLVQHIAQTQDQVARLDQALASCGTSPSLAKDVVLSVMGVGQASVQGVSGDGVLKAMVADMMTEQLEIATYRMLIVLADLAGKSDLTAGLAQSLREEQDMAAWFDENLEHLTRRFIALRTAKIGTSPDHAADAPTGRMTENSGE